jgi:hypothetical protein
MTERPPSGEERRPGAGSAPEGRTPSDDDASAPVVSGERPPGSFDVQAEATLFGFEPTPARAAIAARSRGWRVGGAARIFAVFAVVAPFVAIFPPHAVWLIGALLTGAVLARRRYVERFTLLGVDADCPKCGTPFDVKRTRLKVPHPLSCDACHHESSLRLPAGTLEAHGVE